MSSAGKRSNEQWLNDLRNPGPLQEAALADLRQLIMYGLPYAMAGWLRADDPRFPALAEETVQETLLRVLAKLDSFEGRSQFATWVNKIAVRIALTELRHKRWKNVSLDELTEESESAMGMQVAGSEASPEQALEGSDMMARLQRIIAEELTEKQRRAIVATAIKGMPLDEAARQMGMNRNALYKLIFDGRVRLKRRLAEEDLLPADIMAAFEKR